jgi:uncharacterized glyoxalase superfamily protein PhnB
MTNRSAPPGTFVPVLIYADVAKAIDWQCGAFGFTERIRIGPGPDGTVHRAQLAFGGGAVVVTGPRAELRPPDRDGVSHVVHVQVEDVERHFEHAKQFGARIVSMPTTFPFGERQYSAMDLEGHHWVFSESVADVAPEEWGGTQVKLS